ncbi:MAG: non-ribosomal peptide synthetase, partial [Verrucomicrobiota bacterium]|nr:non-ribosomal peptide synthetase [Verrucomicrobiota bacterium]
MRSALPPHPSPTKTGEFAIAPARSDRAAADRRKLLVDWNRTASDYPRDRCLHELIAAQAARTPDAIAVEGAKEQLTYRELERRANHLARRLHSLGVGPEVLVGICLQPSANLIVALLAVLKAGGAYVPLDPAYPPTRLTFMIGDSAMKVIVTETQFVATLPATDAAVLKIEEALADGDGNGTQAAPRSDVRAENLAYVIYTSGSTGTPKGVMIPHRALVNYLTWAAQAYRVAEGMGAPVHTSISFDLSVTGLFTPLLVGRRVYILRPEPSLHSLGNILRRQIDFSLIKITPAHLELVCASLHAEEVAASTRAFIIGGEALFGASLESWRRCAPGALLVNEYGPTETTVGCCVYFVPENARFEGAIPIGRPIANTQLYVLDADLEPVPIGVTGELYIAGDGVARGYLNRPDLTAQRFLPNPFADDASAIMYRSGDLARYRADGNLEYVGRIDEQIKIRSYRIEPAEIEAALVAHPRVQKAVVIARKKPDGEKFLAAYFLPDNGIAPAHAELAQFLRRRLPDYLVPSLFISLREFPLTTNGKVDRAALPALAPETTPPDENVTAHSTDERTLLEIWERVMQRPVAVTVDFFDLGGHSLLAVRLATEIAAAFAMNVDALVIYRHPTIRELAGVLREQAQGRT